jgi:hypothetical protein
MAAQLPKPGGGISIQENETRRAASMLRIHDCGISNKSRYYISEIKELAGRAGSHVSQF